MSPKEYVAATAIFLAVFVGFPLAYFLIGTHMGGFFPCGSDIAGFICSGP